MNLYTIAICPECGQTFNKYITAKHCSKRCSNKAAARRRLERAPGPTSVDRTLPSADQPNFTGTEPMDHHVLAARAKRMIDLYRGSTTRNGKVIHGGGELLIDQYSPEAIGTYQPLYPIMRKERPPIYEGEKPLVSMGHWRAFGDEDPAYNSDGTRKTPDPYPSANETIANILKQFSK